MNRFSASSVKKAISYQLDVGPARLPHGNLTPEQAMKLGSELEGLGFFDWIRI